MSFKKIVCALLYVFFKVAIFLFVAKKFTIIPNQSSEGENIVSADKITGYVNVGSWHERETLFVRVVRAKDLAGWNPYVKIFLSTKDTNKVKRKTTVKNNCNNPFFNEVVQVYF